MLENGHAQRNHVKVKNIQTPQLPSKLQNQLLSKLKSILKQENQNHPLSSQAIKEIRYAFYNVLVELFAYYKDLVSKDADGEMIFDTKRFFQFSNKQYREFY